MVCEISEMVIYGKIRFLLDLGNLFVDFFGCLAGLVGQFLDFRSHHGEATARFSGPCSLNGCVEGQKVGLLGNGPG